MSQLPFLGDQQDLLQEPHWSQLAALYFNHRYGLLICNWDGCGAVLSGNWRNHLSKHGCLSNLPEEEKVRVDSALNLHQNQLQPPRGPAPIQGLPILTGFQCGHCDFIYPTEATMKNRCKQLAKPKEVYYQTTDKNSKEARFLVCFLFFLFIINLLLSSYFFLPLHLNITKKKKKKTKGECCS